MPRSTAVNRVARSQLSIPPGAQLWCKSSDVAIATGVSSWHDLSGYNRHIVNATGGTQPAYTASNASFNNKPSIDFDGVDNFLAVSFSWAQPLHIFLVAKFNDAFSAGTNILYCSNTADAIRLQRTGGVTVNMVSGATLSLVADQLTPHVYSSYFNGPVSSTSVDGDAATVGNAGTASGNGIILGAFTGGAFAFANCSMVELVAYSRHLLPDEEASLVDRLATEYGV